MVSLKKKGLKVDFVRNSFFSDFFRKKFRKSLCCIKVLSGSKIQIEVRILEIET